MTERKYEHAGVTITFNEVNATFIGTIDGKLVRAPSLDAMKKKIDKARTSEFTAFDALDYQIFYDAPSRVEAKRPDIEKIRVKNLKITRKRYGDKEEFICESVSDPQKRKYWATNGEFTKNYFVPDTAEARAAITNYYEIAFAAQRQRAQLSKAIEDAQAKIPIVRIEDYMKEKGTK